MAVNTVMLYIRMLFLLLVALYTSRVVLHVLGEDDYGIYNVVGGIIMMFGFLNNAMISATQRFITFEQGTNNLMRQKVVFSTAVRIHILLAFIILFFAETFGLWFLNSKMNISPTRLFAANWVFQFSVFSFVINVLNVPLMASVIAHEKMGVYAYISILDAILKLLIVFLLGIFPLDNLIFYGSLLLIVHITNFLLYLTYTHSNFIDCRYVNNRDKKLSISMLSFAGWSFVGNFGITSKDYGVNVVINLFCGPAVNAARAVAYQVNAAANQFVSSFQTAIQPQIVKRYANGEIESMIRLVCSGSKFSFCLVSLLVVPLFARMPFVLSLWLIEVPRYTVEFLQLALLMTMINSMFGPISMGISATGKVKVFQITVAIILFLDLPLSYVLLEMGIPPYSVMYIAIITAFLALVARLLILSHYVPIAFWSFFFGIIIRNLFVFAVMIIPILYINEYFPQNFYGLFSVCFLSFLWVNIMIWSFILDRNERYYISGIIKKQLKNLH